MSLASSASFRSAAELDWDNHPDDEGNWQPEDRCELLTGMLTELGIDIVTTEQWDAITGQIAAALREATAEQAAEIERLRAHISVLEGGECLWCGKHVSHPGYCSQDCENAHSDSQEYRQD